MYSMQQDTLSNADAHSFASAGLMANFPFVSIILPIRNEAAYIERTLNAVLAQDYPKDRMEVIVVDGLSDDGTRNILSKFNVRVLDNPRRIVSAALNLALKEARGDVIVRIDGHCEIQKNHVRRCIELMEETKADCVGGPVRPIGHGLVAKAIALGTSSPMGVGNAVVRYAKKPGWVDTVFGGAYRSELFPKLNYFDEELVRNQDDEFHFRLIQSGGKIWLDPALHITYFSRSTLKTLWRQYFGYGFYKVKLIQKRGAVPAVRHIVPALFVLSIFLSLVISAATRNPWWSIIFLTAYVIPILLGAFWVGRKNPRTIVVLPFVFATLHLAYGFGFINGLWSWFIHPRLFSRKSATFP
jgi:glycosyltransferase involved in cell wall biosynthesis